MRSVRIGLLLAVTAIAAGCAADGRFAVLTNGSADRAVSIAPSTALERAGRHVDVPVGLPDLPPGTRADPGIGKHKANGVRSASVTLRLPGERTAMVVSFGRGSFDGCGPAEPRFVDVNEQPAILTTSARPHRYSTIMWPTSDPSRDGTYSVSGPFSADRVVALAEQMATQIDRSHPSTGC